MQHRWLSAAHGCCVIVCLIVAVSARRVQLFVGWADALSAVCGVWCVHLCVFGQRHGTAMSELYLAFFPGRPRQNQEDLL